MSHNTELGRRGEDLACAYLQERGYEVVARNWRYDHAEIDLVALEGEILHIVEVKTRARAALPSLTASLGPSKLRALEKAAVRYAELTEHRGEVRFDLVIVTFDGGREGHVEYVPGFFCPAW